MEFLDGQMPIHFREIWSSCDGLLLLSGLPPSLYLANPTTREFRELPPSPFSIDSDDAEDNYSLGYDLSGDDYKVVKISFELKNRESNGGLGNVVSVYNLRTNFWRMIESSSTLSFPTSIRDGIFVNGALHWVGLDTVIVLDLVSERFHNMPYPRFGDGVACLRVLNVSGDCLCGFEFAPNENEPFSFWVMKDYGVRDSWVRFAVDYHDIKWIVPSRTGKLLIGMYGNQLAIYDPEEGEVENFSSGNVLDDAIRYEESLIGLL